MIGADVVALIAAGTSLVVGTVGPDGEPRATRGWAAVVLDAESGRVRVLMTGDDPVAVANLAGGRISVTGADVRTLRAVQLKGRVVAVEPPTGQDLADFDAHTDAFFRAVHETDGNPIELLRRLMPHELVAVELIVEAIYDQSPGPAAGASVTSGGRS